MTDVTAFGAVGDGVTKDTAKARQWLRKAADQGDTDAEQLLRQIP